MVFDTVLKTATLLKKKKKEAFVLSAILAAFLIVLIFFQGVFFSHIQSLVTTLGAYVEALTDVAATNENALVGTSIIGYILADSIVHQAIWKLVLAYIGLFGSLFVVWNLGAYALTRQFAKITSHKTIHTFKKFTLKNAKWLGLFMLYTLIYLFLNLKFSLVDSVLLGSSWQQGALVFIDGIVRILFLYFIVQSYTQKKLFQIPKLKQIGTFLLTLVTIFVFDTLIGFLTNLSSIFYVLGFIVLLCIVVFFGCVFFEVSHMKKSKDTNSEKKSKLLWGHIGTIILLFIIGIPFSSFFLITGLENTGVLVEDVELTTVTQLAELLRTTEDELSLLYQSGVRVLVIEFSDFDCPFCKTAQSYVDELHGRESLFVYRRHFPVTSLHPQSYSAALFYECLKAEGFAYETRAFLYETQTQHTQIQFDAFANGLNVNSSSVSTCMDAQVTKDLIEHDIISARSLGMSATPTFYLIPLEDIASYQQFDGADKNKINSFITEWTS